mmetsp:Transcript_40014/g.60561  ORF Transcript_40014/g.60561 Transcript_40014/m.60561 type:complete len:523 (+) Transcript_40014:459-2027(+)
MCMTEENFFTGQDVFKELTDEIKFEGATLNVDYDDVTGSRDINGAVYTLWNVLPSEDRNEDGMALFEDVAYDLVPTEHYKEGQWVEVENQAFVFFDGSTNRPPFLPPAEMNLNKIGDTYRAVGYGLLGVVCFMAIVFLVWTFCFRKTRVVRASKSYFLCIVTTGCVIMISTIIPIGMEEPVSQNWLDFSCNLRVWLFFMGLVLSLSALLTKTWAVTKVLNNPDKNTITVKKKDFFVSWLILFVPNFIMLLTWTLANPFKWERVFRAAVDVFDREIESFGQCKTDHAQVFWALILLIDISFLLYAVWQSYKVRNIQTEFEESRYIAISIASMLQALIMGIPIVIVVTGTPDALYFVLSAIIFVMCCAILLLIFVPKIIASRNDGIEQAKRERTEFLRKKAEAAKPESYDENHSAEDEDNEPVVTRSRDGAAMLVTNPQDPESESKFTATYTGGVMNGNATTLNVPEDSLNTTASANRSLCTADVERGEFVDEFTETNVEEGEVDGLRVVTNPAVSDMSYISLR